MGQRRADNYIMLIFNLSRRCLQAETGGPAVPGRPGLCDVIRPPPHASPDAVDRGREEGVRRVRQGCRHQWEDGRCGGVREQAGLG